MPTASACWSESESAACCTIEENHLLFLDTRLKRITPFFIPKLISNLAPGQIAIRYGARGINLATTSACASGSHAIGEAYRMIRARLPRRGDHRRRRGGADLARRRRIRRDARAVDAQRRARGRQPSVRRASATAS